MSIIASRFPVPATKTCMSCESLHHRGKEIATMPPILAARGALGRISAWAWTQFDGAVRGQLAAGQKIHIPVRHTPQERGPKGPLSAIPKDPLLLRRRRRWWWPRTWTRWTRWTRWQCDPILRGDLRDQPQMAAHRLHRLH